MNVGSGMQTSKSPLSFQVLRGCAARDTIQFAALLPEREVDHPLGCHRPRIPDRVVFEKLIQVLVFGCAYHRIADEGCSATTLRERRDEWIELGVIDTLREAVLEAYDRFSAWIFRRWP